MSGLGDLPNLVLIRTDHRVISMDFENGTIEFHMPDDENIWMISIKNFRYETIELPDDAIQYLTAAAHAIIDYIKDHGKIHGDIDKLPTE